MNRQQTYERSNFCVHKIIQIHNNVIWDQQYYTEYSIIETECEEYP